MRTAIWTRVQMSANTGKPLLLLMLPDGREVERRSRAGVDDCTELIPGLFRRQELLFKPGLVVVDFVLEFSGGSQTCPAAAGTLLFSNVTEEKICLAGTLTRHFRTQTSWRTRSYFPKQTSEVADRNKPCFAWEPGLSAKFDANSFVKGSRYGKFYGRVKQTEQRPRGAWRQLSGRSL